MSEDAQMHSGSVAAEAALDDGSDFRAAYNGSLSGLLTWDDADRVFDIVRSIPNGWWVYNTRDAVPAATEVVESLAGRIDEIQTFLKRNHKADYCGFVYVDDRASPRLIKVFDPRNASSCSLGRPLPAYTLSRMRPVPLPLDAAADSRASGGVNNNAGGGGLVRRILKRFT